MEQIRFSSGTFLQYPSCEYAKISPQGEKWAEGFDVIKCGHPESKYALCVSNIQFNSCLNGKKILSDINGEKLSFE